MLAFVHIEKAAGTTLIHILRRNFFPRYMDVRPLSNAGGREFTAQDLRMSLRVNPFLKCIAGHSIVPYSDLDSVRPNIRFLSLLRDPVERYVSQYRYWLRRLGKSLTFEEFLDYEHTWNFQTRKFSPGGDPEGAKQAIDETCFLVGIVEQFDDFLVLLESKLSVPGFDPTYRLKNVAESSDDPAAKMIDEYHDAIVERNSEDIKLYKYVKDVVLPRERRLSGNHFADRVEALREKNRLKRSEGIVPYADFLARKLYFETATGLARRLHGLPYRGSYRK